MGKRRFAQVASDDEDEAPPPRRLHLNYDSEEDDKTGEQNPNSNVNNVKDHQNSEKMESHYGEEEEEEELEDAKPVGEVIRVSEGRSCYKEFEFDGTHYHLEDSVILTPEEESQKPYVAIIKEISVDHQGKMNIMGQWFYRPEETKKRGGGFWESSDPRELFYSFHLDEVSAESVMHKCVVHFIPSNKQIPNRHVHPGFIVQKVYCLESRRVYKLTDKDYEDNMQEEIDLLVQKSMSLLGDLPDIEPDDGAADHDDQLISKRLIREGNMSSLDVSREEEGVSMFVQSLEGEMPGSCPSDMSEYCAILFKFNVLTGNSQRDKWLEKLLQVIHAVCTSADGQTDAKDKNKNDVRSPQLGITPEDKSKDVVSFRWPDSAVPAVASLENSAHEVSSDYQKYNQKMRQLTFNLKPNALLSRRFLNGELEPLQIVNMQPNELKEGLRAEEMESTEPEESQHMQMTDARCTRCSKKEVGLRDIIQAGQRERYLLECTNCGYTWYASRDQAAILTIGGTAPTSVGPAPLATAKFGDAKKATTQTEKRAVNGGATHSG